MLFKNLTIIACVVGWALPLHAQLNDDFNDGNFSMGTVWSGTGPDFMVNPALQLQLNNTVAATSYLSTPYTASSLDNFEWQFYVNQSFAPSALNFGRVYLASNQSNLTAPLNGYYIQFGEAGALDAIELFRQNGTTTTSICRGTPATLAASFQVRLRVLRNAAGLWQIYTDHTGGSNYTLETSGTDTVHNASAYFGMRCTYTITNAKKFFYDDVYMGPEIVDSIAPQLVSVIPVSSTALDVLFDSPVDLVSSQTLTNYTINNGIGQPLTAVRDAMQSEWVHLNFAPAFTNLTAYTLTVNNLADTLGNVGSDTLNFTYFMADTAAFRDIVINELLADESPQVGLPEAEFIELYNRSNRHIDLSGWTLSDGLAMATLTSYVLHPGDYLILCPHSDTFNYNIFGPSLGVTSFPSLNNAGDAVILKNNAGTLIDEVNYTSGWYHNPAKDDGGYTLEQINPDAPCQNETNWGASNHSAGGTPGQQNSIFNNAPDTTAPRIMACTIVSNVQLSVTFSERPDVSAVPGFVFTVSGGIGVSSVILVPLSTSSLLVNLSVPIDSGLVYTLSMTGVTDCTGNGIGLTQQINFMLPYEAQGHEIILNEILFNPVAGVDDFVEVYNHSAKPLNLKNWALANIDNDTLANHKELAVDDLILMPGEYLAFTTDKIALQNQYPRAAANRIVELPAMPSYNNDSGTVVLITSRNRVSDRFSYVAETMHFPLLESFDGVSLERMDFNRATQDAGNWHSAAQQHGFATPGYLNSQFSPNETGNHEFDLGGELFSPDNDGYQDVMNFHYRFTETGYVGNAAVYDAKGREIKRLLKNELLATNGSFTWNGISDQNEKAAIGIYVVYFEYFNLAGSVKKVKRPFVLAGRF